ncbi:MAG: outer membrane protein OmpA/peptidoglycan-associated protein [Clostridia bacterium]|jgi:outer membrane protein OmpA-like peptidoglycan-associated protein|nr:outer membrane protein OmpA/peptidoglycan-associated protein [Clostridia bacterium]
MVKYRLTKKGKIVTVWLCSFIILSVTLGVSLSKVSSMSNGYNSADSAKSDILSKPQPVPEPVVPAEPQKEQSEISAEQLEKLKFSIFFNADAASVETNSYSDLEALTKAALQYENANIQIEGNCATIYGKNQSKAQRTANYNLSLKRAQAVAEHLKDKGINPDRLIVTANGSDKPLKDNDNPAGRVFNRRVDVFFVNK